MDLWKGEGIDESVMANITHDIERWKAHEF
jgi:hypothetical protein